MPRKRACTERTRAEIVRLRLVEGKSYGQIAEILKISKRMAFNALQYFEKHKTTLKVPYKPRNRKTTPEEDELILCEAKKFPKKTMREIRYAVFGDDESAPSTTTIKWRLVEQGVRTARNLENAPPGTLTRKFLKENKNLELEDDKPQSPKTQREGVIENQIVAIIPWEKKVPKKNAPKGGIMCGDDNAKNLREAIASIDSNEKCEDDPLEIIPLDITPLDTPPGFEETVRKFPNRRARMYSELTRAEVVKLRFEGKSYGEISKMLNISKRMAFNAVKYFEKHKTTQRVPNKRRVRPTSPAQEEPILNEPKQPEVNSADGPSSADTVKRGFMEKKLIQVIPLNGDPPWIEPIEQDSIKTETLEIMPHDPGEETPENEYKYCLEEDEDIEVVSPKSEYSPDPNDTSQMTAWASDDDALDDNDIVEMDSDMFFEGNNSLGIKSAQYQLEEVITNDCMTEAYFEDYEDLEVHELMLKDRSRQQAYCNAIMSNASLFKGKVVLDVGTGTGILAAFCARAGARLVYAVEASNLSKIALQIIEENDMTSIVKVIHAKVEDFSLPESVDKVDIIVSEWMGFYLLHEGMLDSVLYARDKFLKPGGVMFPSEATLYVAPCELPHRFDYWNWVDGIRMTRFGAELRRQKSAKPEITYLSAENLLHAGVVMHWIDLLDVAASELNEINFQAVVATDRPGKHQGFCIWFDCRFPSKHFEDAVLLSTAPGSPETHWKQCVVVLPEAACEDIDEKAPVAFKISMMRNADDLRKYNLEVEILDPSIEEHEVPCDCHMTKCILTKAHLQSMDVDQTETSQ